MAARNDGMPRRNGTTRLKRGTRKSALSVETGARQRFQHRLLKWYRQHGRDLPWRQTSDPYKILVSEVMLQQTQVDPVFRLQRGRADPGYERDAGPASGIHRSRRSQTEEVHTLGVVRDLDPSRKRV